MFGEEDLKDEGELEEKRATPSLSMCSTLEVKDELKGDGTFHHKTEQKTSWLVVDGSLDNKLEVKRLSLFYRHF